MAMDDRGLTLPDPPKNPHAVKLGRRGGKAGSPAQKTARRSNIAGVGRPRRVCLVCGEPVTGGHVDRALDTSCGAHGWRWQRRSFPGVDASYEEKDLRSQIAHMELHLTALRMKLAAVLFPPETV